MNRAERRRAAREKEYSPAVNPMIRDAVNLALMSKQNRDEAILAATGPMLKAVYASVILLMTEEYGFTHEQCLDLLTKLEDKTLYCLSYQEIVDEAFEKTGIRIHFNSAIDRIEEI